MSAPVDLDTLDDLFPEGRDHVTSEEDADRVVRAVPALIAELRVARVELAKCRQREHTAWSTVKALAVAYHAPASERAANAALASLDEQEVL